MLELFYGFLEIVYGVNSIFPLYCTSIIYKQIVLILSCLSESAQGRKCFQAQSLYLSLRTSYVNTR